MKAKKTHRVPLSTQAKGILAYAREHWDGNQSYIFPQERRGRPMDSKRLSDVMHRLEIPAAARVEVQLFNWAASKTHIPEAAAEMVLAHTPPVAVIRRTGQPISSSIGSPSCRNGQIS